MPERDIHGRYPGYDVMAKRNSPSWNRKTREVIDQRLAVPRDPQFFTEAEYATVVAIANRIVPQPKDRPPIPVAALVDHKLHIDKGDGFRQVGMPRERDAWRQGLRALDAESRHAFGVEFHQLDGAEQDRLLKRMQDGELKNEAWGTIAPQGFFKERMAHDIIYAYYSHPTAWNEIGWGGPAGPRGYVRTGYDKRDPWEAAEVKNGDVETALRKNRNV
jgi:gluconate 2-dehydrogenase subunit 3-like protein